MTILNNPRLRRIMAMSHKEIRHIMRDPFTLGLAIGIPILLVAIFGTAIEFRPINVPMLIDDRDQTTTSRSIIKWTQLSESFKMDYTPPLVSPLYSLTAETTKIVLTIDHGFEKEWMSSSHHAPIPIYLNVDGADNTTTTSLLSIASDLQTALNKNLNLNSHSMPSTIPLISTYYLFNPELNTQYFIVPGLIVVVLGIVSILLTALTVARDFENGSMELLLTTPLSPLEIIIGKIIPYLILGMISMFSIYIMARTIFTVPFRGNHLLLILSSFLFLSAYLAQGILISVATKKQVISMQLAIISGMLPSLLLSGLIFPNENMPLFFNYFTMILPARWFMVIVRSLFLMGSSLTDLATPFLVLLLMNVILITLATKKFKRSLE